MLCELYIENLAVIKKATIPFSCDFNVFTGETGAGKSILINGINAVLGRRTNKDIVRSGCDKAVITAFFTKLSDATKDVLDTFGIDYSDDELVISREIFSDGGSTGRVNSRTTNISVIREIGATLIDIHGQHDNQILMYPEKHIDIVDNYAELSGKLSEYKDVFKQLQDTARKIKNLSADEQNKRNRIEILTHTINEITDAQLDAENEDILIEDEVKIAINSSKISSILTESNILLSGSDDETGICEIIDNIINELSVNSDLMPEFDVISKRLYNIKIELSDIGDEFLHLNDTVDIDEERYAYIQKRREILYNIKRKYGPDLKDVIDTYNNSVSEVNTIINSADEIEKLMAQKNELLKLVSEKAEELSELRKKAAAELEVKIVNELKFLDMPNVTFLFEHTVGKLTSTGMDSFQMLITVNAGENPKPIAKIASGGELSRIMLAIKNVIAEKDDVPTLIFDEIDTGVSGRAAQKIGVKLRQISKIRQVLCVTHLSQIAVMADNHLLIQKDTVEDRTVTTVSVLEEEQRKYEIARITSGDHITESALMNAEELLQSKDSICSEILSKA